MSDKTSIEWTDATWNPVTGCTKVSPGCDHCYAETIAHRFAGSKAYPNGFTPTLRPERLTQPLRWTRPRRIFVNSMADLFHDDVPDGMIAAIWFVMGQCAGCIPEQWRGHTFQILTKRHARMRSWLAKWADTGDPAIPPMDKAALRCGRAQLIAAAAEIFGAPIMYDWMDGPRYWPTALPGVWLGVSVEDQKWADIRIPALLDTPAAVRFISAEPMLGPVNLDPWRNSGDLSNPATPADTRIDWVICGGESGRGARPMLLEWACSLRVQCTAAGVPFLFKQWGEWAPTKTLSVGYVSDPREVHGELVHDGQHPDVPWRRLYRRVGKKAAGRVLDGRTWDEYPGAS